MSDKKYSGNFCKTGKIEETPDDYPNCLCQDKKVEEDPDECPNCYYISSRKKKEGQE